MNSFTDWIASFESGMRLTRSTKAVLHAIAADPEEAAYCSAQALANAAGVNVATVVRAAQALGFSGWPTFSAEIRSRYLASLTSRSAYIHNRSQGTLAAAIDKDIELLEHLRSTLDESALSRMAEHIGTANSTGVFATGAYAAPGVQLAHIGQMLGYPIRCHSGSATAMINEARLLQPGDCLLAFSLWKSSRIVLQVAEVAKRQGVSVFVIADRRTALTGIADEYVLVPTETTEVISSLVCAISAVQMLLGLIANRDEGRTHRMLGQIDALWEQTSVVAEE